MSWASHESIGDTLICPECSYDLRGNPNGLRCPECGFEYDATTIIWRGRRSRIFGGPVVFMILPNLLFALILAMRNYGIRYPPPSYWEKFGPLTMHGFLFLLIAGFAIVSYRTPVYIATSAGGVLIRNIFKRFHLEWSNVWGCYVGWGHIRFNIKNGKPIHSRIWLNRHDKQAFETEIALRLRQSAAPPSSSL